MSTDAPTLEEAWDATVTREASANELRVGVVRVLSFGVVTGFTVGYWLSGERGWADVWPLATFLLFAVAAVAGLRRTYHPAMRFAFPLVDAAFLSWVIGRRLDLSGRSPGWVALASISAGLFAATGGLRMDRRSAVWTWFLSLLMLFYTVGTDFDGIPYAVCGLAGIGILGVYQDTAFARLIRGEQGRTLLQRFVHPSLLEQAWKDPGEFLERAPRSVEATVLMTDLRGFTALGEKLDPVQLVELLNGLHTLQAEWVALHGGHVDKFMGDGMLAVFGASGDGPDHAARAVAAARDLREGIKGFNAGRAGESPLKLGMGIHTGRLVSGIVGGGRKMEFTVIGDTVNTASRLESLTKDKGVDLLLSESTRAAAGLQAEPVGEVTLRGRTTPLKVFTLA
jgi:class 3 adenylate cyclase